MPRAGPIGRAPCMTAAMRFVALVLFASAAVACAGGADDASSAGPADAARDRLALSDVVTLPDAGAVDTGARPDAAPDVVTDSGAHVCATNTPKDCSPGTGTGMGNECHDGPSCFVTKVQKAVNDVVAAHPAWFDFNNQWSCPMILSLDAFMDAVVASLTAQGLCAIRDPNAPGEEVTLKHDNLFTENFDIVASTGCARSGSAIYTGWCAPAWW